MNRGDAGDGRAEPRRVCRYRAGDRDRRADARRGGSADAWQMNDRADHIRGRASGPDRLGLGRRQSFAGRAAALRGDGGDADLGRGLRRADRTRNRARGGGRVDTPERPRPGEAPASLPRAPMRRPRRRPAPRPGAPDTRPNPPTPPPPGRVGEDVRPMQAPAPRTCGAGCPSAERRNSRARRRASRPSPWRRRTRAAHRRNRPARDRPRTRLPSRWRIGGRPDAPRRRRPRSSPRPRSAGPAPRPSSARARRNAVDEAPGRSAGRRGAPCPADDAAVDAVAAALGDARARHAPSPRRRPPGPPLSRGERERCAWPCGRMLECRVAEYRGAGDHGHVASRCRGTARPVRQRSAWSVRRAAGDGGARGLRSGAPGDHPLRRAGLRPAAGEI